MTLLLDTHTFLWFCQNDPSLSAAARTPVEDATNRKLVSLASCWEIAIKAGLGNLQLGEPRATYIPNAVSRTGFDCCRFRWLTPPLSRRCRRTTAIRSTVFSSRKL